ncbi:hypothetical protein C8R44DRAFT_879309 [Mycena epipterygia]|nr:hypothetical protein C8R44DRAFT_879309 [Mycena epipterygia]
MTIAWDDHCHRSDISERARGRAPFTSDQSRTRESGPPEAAIPTAASSTQQQQQQQQLPPQQLAWSISPPTYGQRYREPYPPCPASSSNLNPNPNPNPNPGPAPGRRQQ